MSSAFERLLKEACKREGISFEEGLRRLEEESSKEPEPSDLKYGEKFWEQWEQLHPDSFRHLLEDLEVYQEWKKHKEEAKK